MSILITFLCYLGQPQILSKPSLGIDKNLLEDFFSITPPKSKGSTSSTGQKNSFPDDMIGSTKEFHLLRKQGGFILRKNPKATSMPKGVHLTVAYEIRGRDPFKKYSLFDFEMNKVRIKIIEKGATVKAVKENQMIAQLFSHDFKLEVEGFDLNRDLRVKIAEIEGK